MRRLSAFVLMAAAVTASAAFAASPRAFRAKVVAAVEAQTSVHRTESRSAALPGRSSAFTETADVTADSGTERLTFKATFNGAQHHGRARVLLVGGVVYVRGDAYALEQALDLNGAKAGHYAGQWIAIPPGDKLYAGLADGLTLSSVVARIPRGHLSLYRTTLNGRLYIALHGGSSSTALFVPARGEPLPAAFRAAA